MARGVHRVPGGGGALTHGGGWDWTSALAAVAVSVGEWQKNARFFNGEGGELLFTKGIGGKIFDPLCFAGSMAHSLFLDSAKFPTAKLTRH